MPHAWSMPNDARTMSVMEVPNSAPQQIPAWCTKELRCINMSVVHMLLTYASVFHCATMPSLLQNIEQYLFCSRTIPGMYCNKHHLQMLSRLKACYKWWLASSFLIVLLVLRPRCHTTSAHKQKCPAKSPRCLSLPKHLCNKTPHAKQYSQPCR